MSSENHPWAKAAETSATPDPVSQNEGGVRRGLFDSGVRVRVAWRGDASRGRIGGQFRVVSLSAVGGSVFFEVRFRGRGPRGCVLLTEIYKMSRRT